ncbi:hypothetical protein FKM82_029786, partial [Ascaphus truei]
ATPTHNHRRSCLKMKVFVCCVTTSHSGEKPAPTLPQFTIGPEVKIEDLGEMCGFVNGASSPQPPNVALQCPLQEEEESASQCG